MIRCRRFSSKGLVISSARFTITDQLDITALELDHATCDARNIEQVINQPDQVPDLSRQKLDFRRGSSLEPHRLDRHDDRSERVAKLVAEHGQEFILGSAGLDSQAPGGLDVARLGLECPLRA